MAFYDTNFPDDISYGSRGGPRFDTTVIKLRSGHEQRNANWEYPLHEYDVAYGIRNNTQLGAVRNFFLAMLGRAHSFRFKDWGDYKSTIGASTTAATDQRVSVAGTSTTGSYWQLQKVYTISSAVFTRTITKPVSGTVSVAVNGHSYRAANVSTNTLTGVLHMTGTNFTITSTSQSNPCHIDSPGASAAFDLGMGSLYITNVSGMVELNGGRYEILSAGEGGVYIDVDSTLYTAYVADGNAREYVGSAEYASVAVSVTAGYEFDLQARFDSDVFDATHEGFDMQSMNIMITEIRET